MNFKVQTCVINRPIKEALPKNRIKWWVSWNCGKVLLSFGDTIEAKGGAADSVITGVRNGWSKFRD